jgi:hypothetical protein
MSTPPQKSLFDINISAIIHAAQVFVPLLIVTTGVVNGIAPLQ